MIIEENHEEKKEIILKSGDIFTTSTGVFLIVRNLEELDNKGYTASTYSYVNLKASTIAYPKYCTLFDMMENLKHEITRVYDGSVAQLILGDAIWES